MPCSTTFGAGRSSPFLASGSTRGDDHYRLISVVPDTAPDWQLSPAPVIDLNATAGERWLASERLPYGSQ